MSRREMPRIFELSDSINKLVNPKSFFHDFEVSIASNPVKRKHFIHIEREFSKLDQKAWNQLTEKLLPLLQNRHPTRGWSPRR